jgi:hypothetical protein
MQEGSTGGNHNAIEILLEDVFADGVLAWIGADKGVNLGDGDAWNQAHRLRHTIHIHHIGDVSAAPADVNANSGLRSAA